MRAKTRAQAVGNGERLDRGDALAGRDATAGIVCALELGLRAEDARGRVVKVDGLAREHSAAAAGRDVGVQALRCYFLAVPGMDAKLWLLRQQLRNLCLHLQRHGPLA